MDALLVYMFDSYAFELQNLIFKIKLESLINILQLFFGLQSSGLFFFLFKE